MFKSLLKISTIILLVSFCYVSMNYIGQTNAFFTDQATITNTLTAGVLDMTLSDTSGNPLTSPLFNISEMQKGESQQKIVRVKNEGTLDFKYKVNLTNVSGELCSYLTLEAKLDGVKYNDIVKETNFPTDPTDPVVFSSLSDPDNWTFILTLSDDAPESKTCQFNFIFDAWQTNFPDSSQGFTDTERIPSTIQAGVWEAASHLVINEIYIHETNDWIELYNPTDNPIDLAQGYRLERATASGGNPDVLLIYGATSHNATYPRGTIISAHGFYLHVRNKADNSLKSKADALSNFALEPNNVIYLATGIVGAPKNSHNSDSDIVDYVGYGPGTKQYEGSGPAPKITSDKSIERKSLGYDTNNNDQDFIVNDSPTPTNSAGNDCPEIVLNEFLPNADQFPEYIELYNKGDESQDVNGWKIKLSNDTEIIISSDILYGNATSTIIGAEGSNIEWLAIDLSKIGPDILDDTSDTIYLYNENGDKKDEISYPLGSGSNSKPTPGEENETGENISPPDKSFARFPDGTGDWIDPYPTPGGPNKLEEEPEIIDEQNTTPLPQDDSEEPQITEDEDNPDETADEEAETIKEDEESGEGTTEGETTEEDSDTETEDTENEENVDAETEDNNSAEEDQATETEKEPAAEESDDEISPTEEPTDQAEEETPADEEPTVNETVVEEEPSITPEETTIADGDVDVESDGDDGGGNSDDTGNNGDGSGEADTE